MTKLHPTVPGLHEAIHELCAAITAETMAFRNTPDDEASEHITNAAVDRVCSAHQALLAFARADIERDIEASGDMAIIHALALYQQRWLVMQGSYQDQKDVADCLLMDLLMGSAAPLFTDVPLLWHICGDTRDSRPSDEELQAGWEK